jgi:uncharacterized repeat protein (TIGR03803 family)
MRPSRILVAVFLLLVVLLLLASFGAAQTVRTLYNFNGTDGSNPSNLTLAQGRDGTLYGATIYGGTYDIGVIFKITPAGKFTVLHNLYGATDGGYPSSLTMASDGNFYGTTEGGGTGDYGTIFEISPSGTFTVLHNFNGNGSEGSIPSTPPIQASDGNFYGTTNFGGTGNSGTVYKLTPAGSLTVLYNFDPAGGGSGSATGMPTQGGDGYLYILEANGGASSCGRILKLSTAGVLNNTYDFDCETTGRVPVGRLVPGADGNLYGTTVHGGIYDCGTGYCEGGLLFQLAPNFNYTVLYDFGGIFGEGNEPMGITLGSDGKFYGNDTAGGAFSYGSIYRYSPGGVPDALFNWTSGIQPATLTQHTNGAFYGANVLGGTSNLGTVYNLKVGLAPFISLVQSQGKTGSTAQILGQGFTGTTGVTFNGAPAASFTVVRDAFLTAVVPSGATTGKVVVTTPSGALTSSVNFRIVN